MFLYFQHIPGYLQGFYFENNFRKLILSMTSGQCSKMIFESGKTSRQSHIILTETYRSSEVFYILKAFSFEQFNLGELIRIMVV